MNLARLQTILRVMQKSGLLTVPLSANVWMVPLPATVTTVSIVNESGFNPHEVKEEITVARCVILGYGKHKRPDILWKGVGAEYWDVETEDEVISALGTFGFDLRKAMKAEGLLS